ncbi:MAG: hypothetical protein WEF86_13530 [Gemmatimonadota bacterium]
MPTEKKPRDMFVGSVRQTDLEPYTALRWVGTMFKAAAVFLAVALIGEFVAGWRIAGAAGLPTLLGELARTIVLAVVLWGGGDLVRLLIQAGNDVRAERILLSRLVHRTPPRTGEHRDSEEPGGALDPDTLLDEAEADESSSAHQQPAAAQRVDQRR